MAEIIQERIEDRIPELEQLERIGLFSHAEIKAIIKKASDLEYKIHRRTLLKEDFINYVQYEINLLELIQRRRARIKYSFKKDEIEYSMVHRVQGVFGRASAKWKDDVQLWLSYIVFCKKWGTKTHLSKIFSAMLAIHSNKPALWIMAAKWEMEDRLSSESASSVTLKEKYLDWAYRSGGYKKARAVFKSLQESRPFSVEFFRKMMQFEKEQEPCKMVNLREYYERALREFGTSDSDLWMDYIKEELNHPFGKPENCGQIYWRAMKMLQGQSAELFVAKHAMHQAGH